MGRRPAPINLATLALDPSAATPLYRQLCAALRATILAQRLPGGARLPSTRTLAEAMGVSRNTVLNAVEQLVAEGYLEGRHGAGTYVAHVLPERPAAPDAAIPAPVDVTRSRRVSHWAAAMQTRVQRIDLSPDEWAHPQPFTLAAAPRDTFPWRLWTRILARQAARGGDTLRRPTVSGGYEPLRRAIAAHLAASRGVRCDAAQVLIVTGCQHAVELAARVLLDPGDAAWMEDPGYGGGRRGLQLAGVEVVPVPLDREGLVVAAGIARRPDARLAFVAPSCQFPQGETLSLARRLALLAWANRADAWIVEDDYDSEYCFAGRTVPALQSLDDAGRVIYVGTFELVMFPSLRIGYMVVPPDLVDTFHMACAHNDVMLPFLEQAALAEFIAEGHFARHLRRLCALYAERQEAMLEAARPLAGMLEVRRKDAGMHSVGWLPPGADDRAVARCVREAGIAAYALSGFAMEPLPRGALLMSYAATDVPAIRDGMQRLAPVLARALALSPRTNSPVA